MNMDITQYLTLWSDMDSRSVSYFCVMMLLLNYSSQLNFDEMGISLSSFTLLNNQTELSRDLSITSFKIASKLTTVHIVWARDTEWLGSDYAGLSAASRGGRRTLRAL